MGIKIIHSTFSIAPITSNRNMAANSSKTIFVQIKDKFNRIDVLVNNAGVAPELRQDILISSEKSYDRVMSINLKGPFFLTKDIANWMIDLKNKIKNYQPYIINISSTAGQKGAPVTSAYSASKFGVLGLTESLAMEVRKHNIRVTALTPSTVATDMAVDLGLTDGNPDKVMQAEDIAEFIVAQLKLNKRTFIKSAGLWSTNP